MTTWRPISCPTPFRPTFLSNYVSSFTYFPIYLRLPSTWSPRQEAWSWRRSWSSSWQGWMAEPNSLTFPSRHSSATPICKEWISRLQKLKGHIEEISMTFLSQVVEIFQYRLFLQKILFHDTLVAISYDKFHIYQLRLAISFSSTICSLGINFRD